jgi:hypothetical protein
MKYGKKILAEHVTYYNNKYVTVLVLDDKDHYNIHILDEKFKDDEMNTLKLQEPKECITLEQVKNPMYLECIALEHLLWDKFYGFNNSMHSFNVELVESEEL